MLLWKTNSKKDSVKLRVLRGAKNNSKLIIHNSKLITINHGQQQETTLEQNSEHRDNYPYGHRHHFWCDELYIGV